MLCALCAEHWQVCLMCRTQAGVHMCRAQAVVPHVQSTGRCAGVPHVQITGRCVSSRSQAGVLHVQSMGREELVCFSGVLTFSEWALTSTKVTDHQSLKERQSVLWTFEPVHWLLMIYESPQWHLFPTESCFLYLRVCCFGSPFVSGSFVIQRWFLSSNPRTTLY